jgi:phage gpG-like protein
MQISIKVSGDKQVLAKLEKLGDKLTRFGPEMDKIGDSLETYYAGQVFASQGGILGTPWARLSKGYAEEKAKQYPGRGPLVKTGKMIGGFRHKSNDQSVTVSNRMPYFVYHQSSAPRHKIPYRPMMGVNRDVKSIIAQMIEVGVRKRIDEVQL